MYGEDSLLPLSGLQHLAFCERQWALIHLEQSWAENQLTAEGALLHKKVDHPEFETREGMRAVRALPIKSLRLGLTGRADLVEFPLVGGPPCPVEYKRGRPKNNDTDAVQLAAQALCLEEMLGVVIPHGMLFYHQTRRRTAVEMTTGLRTRVETLAALMHALFAGGRTPLAPRQPKCRQCSLVELCQPQWTEKQGDPWTRWQALAGRPME